MGKRTHISSPQLLRSEQKSKSRMEEHERKSKRKKLKLERKSREQTLQNQSPLFHLRCFFLIICSRFASRSLCPLALSTLLYPLFSLLSRSPLSASKC
ncbi:hypothetical protein E2C01_030447 [Portunus trituberculatus]|uniref:Uncharacterized protein n=1 Tax=Portunus trituberculatus TaxID=210409 RepID=A0A5B7EU99_PORTR|nr:hypothetical protein [Portunus trituberculatus]